jgi:hypothetical protein
MHFEMRMSVCWAQNWLLNRGFLLSVPISHIDALKDAAKIAFP